MDGRSIDTLIVISNTISYNKSKTYGAGYAQLLGMSYLENNILWENSCATGQQIFVHPAGNIEINYCNIQGDSVVDRENLNADPLFANPSAGAGLNYPGWCADWRLLPSSPCIDAGLNDSVHSFIDIDGNYRIWDGDTNAIATVDMGAYELGAPPFYFTVNDTTMEASDTSCFNAYNTLTIAGDDRIVTIDSGGYVNYIAGNIIIIQPGFHAEAGSYCHCYITTTNDFCDNLIINQLNNKELTVIKDISNDNEIKAMVFPNPNNGKCTIEFLEKNLTGQLSIYNLHGQVMHKIHFANKKTLNIDLKNFVQGIYFLNITTEEFLFTKSIIKLSN